MLLDEMRTRLAEFEQKDEDCAEYDGIYIGTSEATKELREIVAAYEKLLQRQAPGLDEMSMFRARKSKLESRFEVWKKKHCGVAE
jgi:hypothetical protein